MQNKKGLSTVIAILIIIAITLIATTIVWGVAKSVIDERVEYSEACSLALLENLKIDTVYTCYRENTASPSGILRLYLNIGNIELEKVMTYITYRGETKVYELNKTRYDLSKNSGKKYDISLTDVGFVLSEGENKIDAVKIAPVIKGQQCAILDSFYQIPICQ
jgi:FlaG/FlaF family flagellin (archaellin)